MSSKYSKGGKVPKNWPPEISFLTAPIYSRTLQSPHLTFLRSKNTSDPTVPTINTAKGPCSLVKITPISTPSHPAYGQCGLFAASDLKPGTLILQYMGEIHVTPSEAQAVDPSSNYPVTTLPNTTKPDPHANSNYDLSLDRELGIGIDADKSGTEARFINDYRGVAGTANAEFREIWDGNRGQRGMGVFVLKEGKGGKGKNGKSKVEGGKSGKGIRKGEEILVSYGRGFWGARKDGGDKDENENENGS